MIEAHTAEHLFARSMTRLVPDLKIRKVETTVEVNRVYLESKRLDWDLLFEAEKMVNEVIDQGKKVEERYFESLDAAREAFPNLRAMDERISDRVRVVEIEDYDVAACIRDHAKNTKDCKFFLITSYSKAGESVYEVNFEVGMNGKLKALELARTCMVTSEIFGANLQTLEKTAQNLKEEQVNLRRRLSNLNKELLREIPYDDKDGIKVYTSAYEDLDDRILMERAGELVKNPRTIVMLGNASEKGFIVLARSHDINMNCNEVLNEILSHQGWKGGGKENFASGSVSRELFNKAFDEAKIKVMEIIQHFSH